MHQIIVEALEPDGVFVGVVSGGVVSPDTPLRFTATGLIPIDFNTVEFIVRDADGFDVIDTFESSNALGIASSTPRKFPVPGSYTLSALAKDLANTASWHPVGVTRFRVGKVVPEIRSDNKWLMVGAATLAVVGVGWAIVTARKR